MNAKNRQRQARTQSLLMLLCWGALPLAAHADFKPAFAPLSLDRDRVAPGGTLQATYTFRASGPAPVELLAFVPVVRPDGSHLGADFAPDLPTTQWPAAGFVREGPFPIAVPADAAPGKYAVWVGLFSSSERIEFENPDRQRGAREYEVGEFEVVDAGTVAARPAVFAWLPVDEAKVFPRAKEPATAVRPGAKTLDHLTLMPTDKVHSGMNMSPRTALPKTRAASCSPRASRCRGKTCRTSSIPGSGRPDWRNGGSMA